jgi:hypothetical protein
MTSPNSIVGPVHPKAMPIILTTNEGREVGMRAHGMSLKSYSDRCPTTRSKSWRAAQTRKIVPRLESS